MKFISERFVVYDMAGEPLIRHLESFKHGMLNGPCYYYIDGKLNLIINYADNKYDGEKLAYTNGIVNARVTYKLDLADGPYEEYYLNGSIKIRGQFKHDKKTGEWIYFDTKGNEIGRAVFKNDKLVEGVDIKFYDVSERVAVIEHYKNKKLNGQTITFYNNGNIDFVGNYADNKAVGTWRFYYPNGSLRQIRNYFNDKLDGLHFDFFQSGQLAVAGKYVNGKKDGEWIRYNLDNSIDTVDVYVQGKKMKKKKIREEDNRESDKHE